MSPLIFVFGLVTVVVSMDDKLINCEEPIVKGKCRARMPSFGYDTNKKQCVSFVYGGCQGNSNRFETNEECEEQCGSKGTHGNQNSGKLINCEEPIVTGKCRARMPSFGYDTNKKQCVSFVYGGCQGNSNRFETNEECEEQCGSKGTYGNQNSGKLINCEEPIVTGKCRARMPSFGYDTNKKQCVSFVYGGCQGNSNRFETNEECEEQCGSKGTQGNQNSDATVCELPMVTGMCLAHFPRYGFDNKTKSCVQFVYGGCGGNDNNFKTLAECRKTCG